MFARLLPFELNLQLKQIGFWITLTFVLIASIAFTSITSISTGERIKSNGSITVAVLISGYGLFSIFFGAIYVVSGIMRDHVSKSLEIIHATPVPTSAMILSRFAGAYAATLLSLLATVVGIFLVQFMPWTDSESLGPVNIMYYLHPMLIFVVLNALLVTAIFTTVATVTRQRTMVYVSAVALFILYSVATSFISDRTPELLVALIDPFGTTALAQEIEFWPADEQNSRLTPLAGYVGINRVFWALIAGGLFVVSFALSKRGIVSNGKTKGVGAAEPAGSTDGIELYIPKQAARPNPFAVMLRRARFEYVATVRSVAFMILGGLILTLFGLFIALRSQITPVPILPTNPLMAGLALAGAFLPLLLITIFFAGEIVWRDRVNKITELVDSTPTLNWPFMAGKWVAMFGIILTIVTAGMLLGIGAQLLLGDVEIDLGTHLSNAYIEFAPRMLFYAALVMFIQNFMPNRIIGMVVGGIVVCFFQFAVAFLPFYHPLMNFGATPDGGFSEIDGFATPDQYFWFLIYWTGLSGLFIVASIWLWRRGLHTSLVQRFTGIRSQLSIATGALAAVSAVVFFGAGWTIFNGFNNENNYETRTTREARLAKLENELGDQLNAPLPKIRSVEADVQFYPSENTATASGTFRMVNTTDEPIEQMYLSFSTASENIRQLDLQGANWSHETEAEKWHAEQGYRLYKFDRPLGVDEATTLSFEIHYPAPTLGGTQLVRNNGTFVNNFTIMPVPGITDFRLTNPDRRRQNDLPELEQPADRTDQKARRNNFITPFADYVDFNARVCTDEGQIPIAPGVIKREYTDQGRICRNYQPNEPILNFFAFMSADYEVKEDSWTSPDGKAVDLSILYDAQHDYNIDLMIKAMKDSLDVFHETFGPYQYDYLRILEFPYANFAQAFAGTVPFSENIGFVRDPGDPDDNESVDLATYVTMHEIGHQWFAHQIVPANVKGFNVLSEGLTENTALTAYERTYGWQKARRILENRSINGFGGYLIGRTQEADDEEPLATARGGQQYLVYAKASWVFWGLKQYIGEDNMQSAIRAFLEEYGRKGPPYPTTLELIDYLRDAAGPDYQQLITDYWDRITFWDLKFDEENTTVTGDGATGFKVDIALNIDKKVASKETGREVSVTEAEYAEPEDGEEQGKLLRAAEGLTEWVEIGFYDKDPAETFGGEWIKLERVHITEMETTHTFQLDTRPTHIVVDPRRLLIERNVGDNTFDVPSEDES